MIGAAAALVLAFPSMASAATYEGHIKGEPQTNFDVTITKDEGVKRMTRVLFNDVPITCEDGPTTASLQANAFAGNRVRHGEFDAREDLDTTHIRVQGELKRGGKAAGVFRYRYDAGGASGLCDTGGLDWVGAK